MSDITGHSVLRDSQTFVTGHSVGYFVTGKIYTLVSGGQAHTIRTRSILLWPQPARPTAWHRSATGIIIFVIIIVVIIAIITI